jgi:ABC-2 type transport system ATP-binding protein
LHEVEAVTRSFLLICGGRLLASGTAAEARQMLANLPNEFVLVTNAPHRLAALLAERQIADSLRIDGPSVTVATRRPAELAKQLPLWLTEARIEVSEMRSTDESLQGLFDSLMKIHRGEIG